jgi:hypothetical protein
MMRRPLHSRFSAAVRAGRKTTTMREKAWPVGVPILLYNWSEKPYRSTQLEVAVVVVEWVDEVDIWRDPDGKMSYGWQRRSTSGGRCLWEREGFESQTDMDMWFRPLAKPGVTLKRKLMGFRLVEERGAA